MVFGVAGVIRTALSSHTYGQMSSVFVCCVLVHSPTKAVLSTPSAK